MLSACHSIQRVFLLEVQIHPPQVSNERSWNNHGAPIKVAFYFTCPYLHHPRKTKVNCGFVQNNELIKPCRRKQSCISVSSEGLHFSRLPIQCARSESPSGTKHLDTTATHQCRPSRPGWIRGMGPDLHFREQKTMSG